MNRNKLLVGIRTIIDYLLFFNLFGTLLVFLLIIGFQAKAQVGRGITYADSYYFGAYPSAAGYTGTAFAALTDDAISPAYAIPGFKVSFGGVDYSSFHISSNGFIILSNAPGGTPAPIASTPINNLAAIPAGGGPLIAPLWDDLIVGGAGYKLGGGASNGLLAVEWTNVYWDKNAASPYLAKMQIRMYSSAHSTYPGRILFYYQPIVPTVPQAYGTYSGNSGGASIGIADVCGGDYYSLPQATVFLNSAAWINGTASKAVNTTNINNLGEAHQAFVQVQTVQFDKLSPPNDQCAGFIDLGIIPVGASTSRIATLLGSTNTGTPSGACYAANTNDVWFRVSKPANTTFFRISTDFASFCKSVTTSVEVYTGTCAGGLTSVACSTSGGIINANNVLIDINDSTNSCSAVDYYIRVAADASAQGDFQISVENYNPSNCGKATIIPNTLPQVFSCQTTCGSGNDYNSTNACSSIYMNGEDFVYTYTPSNTANSCIAISVNTFSAGTNPGLFILDNCPDSPGANCIASKTASGNSVVISYLSLNIGTTYYIIVDNNNSPACIPFEISVTATNCVPPQPTNVWTQKNNFTGFARNNAVGFAIGDKGYYGTGLNSSGITLSDFWEFDPLTNTWSQKADFGGVARQSAVAFAIGNKGYVGTGNSSTSSLIPYLYDFWEYDPSTNAWTQKADFAGGSRNFAVGFSIGTKGYIGTGSLGFASRKDFWEYDPFTNAWTQKADFAALRYIAVGFSVGSKGYIGTGYYNGAAYNDFWEYNPGSNSWTQKADFTGSARYDAVGFSIGGRGYLGSGYDQTPGYKGDFYEYNPVANSWSPIAAFNGSARYNAVGFSIGTKGYFGSGRGIPTALPQDFWEYNPVPYCDLTLTVSASSITCFGAQDASATITVGGQNSTSTGTYIIDGGSSHTYSSNPFTLSNLGAGSHTISVSIDAYCSSAFFNFTVTGPNSPINSSATISACNSYTWNNQTYYQSGTYSYSTLNSAGCDSTATLILTVHTLEVSVLPGTSILCFGGMVPVTVSVSGGIPPYNGTGVFNQGAGTVSYNVSDSSGCTGNAMLTLIEPAKVEGATLSTPANCGLSDGSATVNASGGTGVYNYLWPDGQTTATANSLMAGTYTVDITDGNSCTGTATAIVSGVGVLPDPAGLILGPSGACRNSCGIVYSVPPVSGASSYSWMLPSGASGSSTTNSITLCFDNTYSGGFLCVTPSNYCGTSAQSCINIPAITIKPSQPGFIIGNQHPCGPNIVIYSIPLSMNALSYNWSVTGSGLAILSGQGTNTISVSFPADFGQGSVSVNMSNCIGTTSTRNLFLTGIPTHSNVLVGPSYVCANSSNVAYFINPVIGTNTYTWSSSGDITIASSSGSSCLVNFGSSFSSGTINVATTSPCGSFSRTYTIRSVPIQPGNIFGPGTNLCGQNGVTYSLDPVTSATSYTWTVPAGAAVAANTGASITLNFGPSFTGSGNICVTANNSCGSSVARCYSLSAVPAVPLAILGPSAVCKSSSAVYTVSAAAGATNYSWYSTAGVNIIPNGIGLSADANFNFATSNSTVITVRANNACGISQPFNKAVSVDLNCRNAKYSLVQNSISIYPNPSIGSFTLEFNQRKREDCMIKVLDLLGNSVFIKHLNATEGLNTTYIDVSYLSKGIYFVLLATEESEKEMVKLVLQ